MQEELEKKKRQLEEETIHRTELKEECEQQKKELTEKEAEITELKVKLAQMESLTKVADELEVTQKELASLKALNKTLQNAADERAVAVELMESLQKQHELMVKENTDLKAALFEAENSMRSSETTSDSFIKAGGEKKVQIIEEIRQILAEVIYAYKTMGTNAKQYMSEFEEKKDRAQDFIGTVEKLTQSKKKEEQTAILKALEGEAVFLKGFPPKSDQSKLMVACLNQVATKKAGKMHAYEDEISKFNTMIGVSASKVTEYEQRLAFYY